MPFKKLWSWFASQELGIVSGTLAVLLLAVGSVIMTWHRQELYADLSAEDLSFFFKHGSWWHFWFYLLIPTLAIYGLNTLVATSQRMAQLLRKKHRPLGDWGPSLIHLAFVLGMIAHLIAGFWAKDLGTFVLTQHFQSIEPGLDMRLKNHQIETYEDGTLKKLLGKVEIRDAQGVIHQANIGFNQPYFKNFYTQMYLFMGPTQAIEEVHVAVPHQICHMHVGELCEWDHAQLWLKNVAFSQKWGPLTQWHYVFDGQSQVFWLPQGEPAHLMDGSGILILGLDTGMGWIIKARSTPHHPLALLAILLLSLGLLFMGKRWIRWR